MFFKYVKLFFLFACKNAYLSDVSSLGFIFRGPLIFWKHKDIEISFYVFTHDALPQEHS